MPAAQYDGDGNPIGYPWTFSNGGAGSGGNAFDSQDRLLTFEGVLTNWWRPDGLRAYKSTSTQTYFLYDGGQFVAELSGTGSVVNYYTFGAGGLIERRSPTLGNTYVYTFDPSGNLVQRHIIGSSLAADYTASYDAFGQQTGCLNSGAGFEPSNQDAIGWGGQWGGYTDQETAGYKSGSTNPAYARLPLVLCGYRFYDPSTGRFLNRDPQGMAGGVNLYAYTRNNPVNFYDPMGLDVTIFGLQFGWGGTKEGLKTGFSVTADTLTFGLYSSPYKNKPGARVSGNLALVGREALLQIATLGLAKAYTAYKAAKVLSATEAAAEATASLLTKCFPYTTPVQMADGSVKCIGDIREGDLVLSRDPETGQTCAKKVVRLFTHETDATLVLTFGNGERIETTPTHPFFVAGRGFVEAGQLGIGNVIVTRAGPNAVLMGIANKTGRVRVYNFEVADFHTYFVGANDGGLWVHNQCLTVGQIENAYNAATQSYKGGLLSAAGRALAKHNPVSRLVSAFPIPRGAPAAINTLAHNIVSEILLNPKTIRIERGAVFDIVAPDGRGIRFFANGALKGFLEPK